MNKYLAISIAVLLLSISNTDAFRIRQELAGSAGESGAADLNGTASGSVGVDANGTVNGSQAGYIAGELNGTAHQNYDAGMSAGAEAYGQAQGAINGTVQYANDSAHAHTHQTAGGNIGADGAVSGYAAGPGVEGNVDGSAYTAGSAEAEAQNIKEQGQNCPPRISNDFTTAEEHLDNADKNKDGMVDGAELNLYLKIELCEAHEQFKAMMRRVHRAQTTVTFDVLVDEVWKSRFEEVIVQIFHAHAHYDSEGRAHLNKANVAAFEADVKAHINAFFAEAQRRVDEIEVAATAQAGVNAANNLDAQAQGQVHGQVDAAGSMLPPPQSLQGSQTVTGEGHESGQINMGTQ